jgi:Family of unknown function (DUF6588)
MKKAFTVIVISFFFWVSAFAQIEDRFSELSEKNIDGYAKPFATTLGTALNSGSYYSAHVPEFFGFSFSVRGMLIFIPDDQTKFTPVLPDGYTSDQTTATIYGNKGSAYGGPDGYITTPPGINRTSVPVGLPQISASFMGTEIMLRYLPKIPIADRDLDMFGIGIKHSISRYIPLIPIDIAVQFLYNTFTISDLIDTKSIAFNAEVSKDFGSFTPYFGLQYESTNFKLDYTISGDPNSGDPLLRTDQKISAELDGDNKIRATIGGSIKLAILVLNADFSVGAQSVFSSGLTFEF